MMDAVMAATTLPTQTVQHNGSMRMSGAAMHSTHLVTSWLAESRNTEKEQPRILQAPHLPFAPQQPIPTSAPPPPNHRDSPFFQQQQHNQHPMQHNHPLNNSPVTPLNQSSNFLLQSQQSPHHQVVPMGYSRQQNVNSPSLHMSGMMGGGAPATPNTPSVGKSGNVSSKFTDEQREKMEELYARAPYPSAEQKLDLANAIQLKKDQIQRWFEGRRKRQRLMDQRNEEKASAQQQYSNQQSSSNNNSGAMPSSDSPAKSAVLPNSGLKSGGGQSQPMQRPESAASNSNSGHAVENQMIISSTPNAVPQQQLQHQQQMQHQPAFPRDNAASAAEAAARSQQAQMADRAADPESTAIVNAQPTLLDIYAHLPVRRPVYSEPSSEAKAALHSSFRKTDFSSLYGVGDSPYPIAGPVVSIGRYPPVQSDNTFGMVFGAIDAVDSRTYAQL